MNAIYHEPAKRSTAGKNGQSLDRRHFKTMQTHIQTPQGVEINNDAIG